MTQVDIHQTVVGRIVERLALGNQALVQCHVVVADHLADDGQVLLFRLQDNQSASTFAARTSSHLRHHHEGMFIGTEVGLVQHTVGIDDAHHADLVEIQSLGNHLCTYQYIGAACSEVADDALIAIACASGVQVHTRDAGFGKCLAHLFLYLLSTIAVRPEVSVSTARTLCGHLVDRSAIVARQLVQLAMQRQFHITMLTGGHPATLVALYHGCKTATVLKQDGLFATLQGLADTHQQQRRERPSHHLAALQVSRVHHLYLRQFHTFVAFLQFHQSVLACLGVVIALQRGCGRSQQHLGSSHLRQHDSSRTGMIAGCRVLLLVARLVFLVHNDQSQALEREHHRRTGPQDDVIGIL